MRYLFTPLILFAFLGTMTGQTMEQADWNYKYLVEMYNRQGTDSTVTKDTIYQKALDCTIMYTAIMKRSPRATDDYGKARKMLRSLFTFLNAGAGYYSSLKGDNDRALAFSKTAVDLAMMRDMADMGFRQGKDYPGVVHFSASHSYNTGDYASAVRYLNEFINITAPEQHTQEIGFLREARRQLSLQRSKEGAVQDVTSDIPDFDVFARGEIRRGMEEWAKKDPYETVDEYKLRINDSTARERQMELQRQLQAEYVERFAEEITFEDLTLKPYDAENQSFLILTPRGAVVLPVPRTGGEARDFASTWNETKLVSQEFAVIGNKPALASMTFLTPAGKTYSYNNSDALAYNEVVVDANFSILSEGVLAETNEGRQNTPKIGKKEITVGQADVDIDIPVVRPDNVHTVVLIIANEDYQYVTTVDFANNDGQMMKTYSEKVLGVPEGNIRYVPNATYGNIRAAMNWLKNMTDSYEGRASIIFYYVGHGAPDVKTNTAYLLPVDIPPTDITSGYSLEELYAKLGEYNAKQVTVFLDACFSGANRGGGMLAKARGVELDVEAETPVSGNLVVFSAATGNQTAHPYTDKQHGLFTYFLLKKLKETKGNATLGVLGDYITHEVRVKSAQNDKPQTPTVLTSESMAGTWRKLKLKSK